MSKAVRFDIPVSSDEHEKGYSLAERLYGYEVDTEKFIPDLEKSSQEWQAKKKEADIALWNMLGDALALSLVVRVDQGGHQVLKEYCEKNGVRFNHSTPIETLVVKAMITCKRALACKYSAVLRGAIIREMTPDDLRSRRCRERQPKKITLDYLIKALTDTVERDPGEKPKHATPHLKWTKEAAAKFGKKVASKSRIALLVEATTEGYRVTNVASSVKLANTFLTQS
jgi:hypothetical protein